MAIRGRWDKLAIQKLGLTESEINRYSVNRAIRSLYDPESVRAPFERDLSQQICKRDNRETNGILIPSEILNHRYAPYMPKSGHILTDQFVRGLPPRNNSTRARAGRTIMWSTDTAGGYLVDEELRTLIEVLVENTLALQNCPVLNVEGAPVNIPGQTNRVSPKWVREDPIDFGSIEFSNVTTQTTLNALTGEHFALLTISSVKYIGFKSPSDDTKAKLSRLEVGNTIKVGALTWTVGAAFDSTNNRIQINADAVSTGLSDGTEYTLEAPNEITETALTFSNIEFNPKFLKVMVQLSRTLRLLSDTDMEMFTRNDIAIGISKAMDTALIFGTGASNQPKGVKSTTGINSLTWDSSMAYAQVVNARRLIAQENIATNNLKWLTSWYFPNEMRTLKRLGAQTRRPIMGMDGRVVGVPVEVTSQIPGTTAVLLEGYLGNWMESAITLWQDLEIAIDPYTLLHQGIDRIVANLTMDFNVLRPKAFCRLGGA